MLHLLNAVLPGYPAVPAAADRTHVSAGAGGDVITTPAPGGRHQTNNSGTHRYVVQPSPGRHTVTIEMTSSQPRPLVVATKPMMAAHIGMLYNRLQAGIQSP